MSFGVFEITKPAELPCLNNSSTSPSEGSPTSWLDGVLGSTNSSRSSKDSSPTQKVNEAIKSVAPKTGLYKFINSSRPHDHKATEHRRTVRSQAAKLQPLQDDAEAAAGARKRRRQTRLNNRNVTFRIDLRVNTACQRAIKRSEKAAPQMKELASIDSPRISKSPDGGWPMPFARLPSKTQAFAPGLIHHYLTVLAVDIPELDLIQPGLLRSSWFPMALTEPATFQVILLTAASHYAMINNMQRATQLLSLRQETLRLINTLLRDSNNAITDAAIAAVAKLASYEAQFGDPALYQIHMDGLIRLVMLRGGLSKLGLNGLLMRMLLWIDINARHLLNTPLYIASCFVDRGEELPPPNPAMYIGGV